jgi:hypothetical protein
MGEMKKTARIWLAFLRKVRESGPEVMRFPTESVKFPPNSPRFPAVFA